MRGHLDQVKERDRLKVIFVTSSSHSGSTLLDLMLNAHPEVISVGELKQLGRFARLAKKKGAHRCTCGAESVWHCPFWTGVNAATKRAIDRKIDQLNVENYESLETFDQDNVALFKAISITAGKQFVVDSSKSRTRLKLLLANRKLDIFPIFLMRDPKGQIYSSAKKRRNQRSLAKLIADYVVTNREIYNLIKHRPHAVVRYEQLVQNPEHSLSLLMQQFGLAFHPHQLDWAVQERHNVGGNHMRWGTTSELKLDETWRQKLSLAQKLAIDAATLPGRLPFLKFGPPNWRMIDDVTRAEESGRKMDGLSRSVEDHRGDAA
jgi:hypothetical protein